MNNDIIKAALFTPIAGGRWGLPLLAWGEPGAGKSGIIEGIALAWGLACECLSPGERGEGAFGVVPVPEAGVLTYPRPAWTTRFDGGAAGVVFVDEMTTASPALQAPLLGLILSRRIGGHTLPPRVRVIGAANPPDQAAGGWDLAPPVANRLGHIDWAPPSVEEHTRFMLGGAEVAEGTGDAEVEEARVLAAWPVAWARAVALETAFLARRPEMKNKCPRADDAAQARAWPSDRSWEAATRALASASVHGLTADDTETFVGAFIGAAVAGEWFAWIAEQDLPDPAALLDGAATFTHNPVRLDRTVATLTACVATVAPKVAPKRTERAAALWRLMEGLITGSGARVDLDVFVPACAALVDAGLVDLAVAGPTLATLQPVLRAAGVGGGK